MLDIGTNKIQGNTCSSSQALAAGREKKGRYRPDLFACLSVVMVGNYSPQHWSKALYISHRQIQKQQQTTPGIMADSQTKLYRHGSFCTSLNTLRMV